MSKRSRTVEKIGVSSGTKRKDKIRKENLDDVFQTVIDETMRQVFKEQGTKIIKNLMEDKFHLKQEKISEKPEVFSAGLETVLGSGASMIEILVLRNLHRKLELKFEEKKGYDFSDYINELRKRYG